MKTVKTWPNFLTWDAPLIGKSSKQKVSERKMIEVVCNDRLGKKIRVKCNADDTIGDLKKLIAAQVG